MLHPASCWCLSSTHYGLPSSVHTETFSDDPYDRKLRIFPLTGPAKELRREKTGDSCSLGFCHKPHLVSPKLEAEKGQKTRPLSLLAYFIHLFNKNTFFYKCQQPASHLSGHRSKQSRILVLIKILHVCMLGGDDCILFFRE